MDRTEGLNKLKTTPVWDVAVIGGGASGLGVALDALSRGLSVVLLEKADFAKGTSSRSTKLLHGGVRYLAQGDVGLVLEALKERGGIMKNAPHVSHTQAFVIPIYTYWDKWKYSIGLKVYDLMAGGLRIGKSQWLSKRRTVERLPTIRQQGLKGGVLYYDGQFDDARLALNIAQTCTEMGGCVLNYMKVTSLTKDEKGLLDGVHATDQISQSHYTVKAKAVVNATGVFADNILRMDTPDTARSITPSQGAHLVFDLSFLGGQDALMIPKTSDGRVLFGIPWHGKLLLGTTDTVRKKPQLEPRPLAQEIDFILENCARYLVNPPSREDALSVFAGLRPLAAAEAAGTKTKEISRSHKVTVTKSQLISIIGGKWTTFRKMGEDTVDALVKLQHLQLPRSASASIKLHGYEASAPEGPLAIYGSDAFGIRELMAQVPALAKPLHPRYPHTGAEVVWMVRQEMALKVEDVLARRMRILFLDARAAQEMAPAVAEIMRAELGESEDWGLREIAEFEQLAKRYFIHP
ncbi:glycerol-3-phosphate dehydrogenase/oxidase [Pontibacter sp. E15-1]|uniref:glycerol-3-phosphate dehydrogenase/oxidase n=1 Tax=Pontibacter sp. E15-1 TaxID=2919918 RepID=UPI001F4F6BA0|nr:glycerol-3-phosphate dehydrogenase/oxidase [Pontibacter sp. E15-1]MCJ8167182.1 glycerol-3-phosphate dehydrogenase/oxidase [Pontibacter sp. E15-1]